MHKFLFVGEKKSKTAQERGWSWQDGRLAAKQLFDALYALAINPTDCKFANAYQRGHLKIIRDYIADGWTVIAMGQKAQYKLATVGIPYRPMIHPAARGRIRNKSLYFSHVKEVLEV